MLLCRAADGNRTADFSLSVIEHRDTEYQVVQTANPTGWKWIVLVGGQHVRTGTGYNRADAMARAQRAIATLLKSRTSKVVSPPSIEGQ